jgi:hypothetical protein
MYLLHRWLRRPGAIAVLSLLLLPLAVFSQQALLYRVFYVADVQHYFYPYHVLVGRLSAQGDLPLWNAYAFSGIPLLGDGQTALFYPPNWLFLILPGPTALNYDVLLQFCIAGVGMYLYARSLALFRLPAFVAAVAYMFGGFMTARVVHLSIMSGAALLPLLFCCVERALRTGTARWFAAATVVVALQALSGHPQVPIYSALALGVYVTVHICERLVTTGSWRQIYLPLLRLAGIYTLGYGLAAIQLVPWIEFARMSPRAVNADFDFIFLNSTAGSDWLLFIFPNLYGTLEPGFYAARSMDSATLIKTWEHSAYVGILPLALALYGLTGLSWFPRRRATDKETDDRRWTVSGGHPRWYALCALALLLLLGLLIAAGKYTPLAGLIYATPLIGKLRDSERALVLVAFAVTSLAAIGMQQLLEGGAKAERGGAPARLLVIAAATMLIPLSLVLFAQQPAARVAFGLQASDVEYLHLGRPNAYIPLLLALASATLLAWWSRRPIGTNTQALAVTVVVLDMVSYAALFNPTIDSSAFTREPQVLHFLRQDPALFRKATFLTRDITFPHDKIAAQRAAQEMLIESWGMVYDIADINGFNSLQPRRYTDYLFGPDVSDVSYGYLSNEQLLQPESPILSVLNVKYVLVPNGIEPRIGHSFRLVYANQDVRVYENTQVYPRAYFVNSVRAEPDARAVLRIVTAAGFDGRELALVESAQPPALGAVSPGATLDQVTFTRYRPNQSILMTSTTTQRFLVLSEMYFPGWHAYVDGEETPIYRTNYLFRGIVVPPGQHTISFVYRPASLLFGAAISTPALLVVVGLFIRWWRTSASSNQYVTQHPL